MFVKSRDQLPVDSKTCLKIYFLSGKPAKSFKSTYFWLVKIDALKNIDATLLYKFILRSIDLNCWRKSWRGFNFSVKSIDLSLFDM